MSKIWSVMNIGRGSMMNSKKALQTVSHNIANKNTEGYSRQRVETEANVPVGMGRTRIGTGANTKAVNRINNGYLEKQIQSEGGKLGYSEARAEALARVEQVYNEQINKGLNKYMAEFFNAFRELSNNPESMAARNLVKETADHLSKDFHRVNQQLNDIQADIDYQVVSEVESINRMTSEIADLNEKIQLVELNGGPANDERDRRDQLLKDLGAKININWAEGDNGQVTITAGNSAVLVSGYSHRELMASSTPESGQKREGNFDIYYKATKNGTPINVTRQITGGSLGGLLQVRDQTVNDLIDNMDQMAYGLANEVNRAHTQGFDRYNNKGQTFFHVGPEVTGASNRINLSDSIMGDVGAIAAAASPNSPGDNRIANIISSIQYKKAMGEGTATFDNFYSTIVGDIGLEAEKATSTHGSQKDIVEQLKNIRESISGVSLDEETTKMIEYQKSFDASARLIRAADEMMDTVLNIKRM